jgi:hypothetical protein
MQASTTLSVHALGSLGKSKPLKPQYNGTVHFKIVNDCLNTSIYFYLETAGGQNYFLYLNVVHCFNTSVNKTPVAP